MMARVLVIARDILSEKALLCGCKLSPTGSYEHLTEVLGDVVEVDIFRPPGGLPVSVPREHRGRGGVLA
jgi:hypothetical protein